MTVRFQNSSTSTHASPEDLQLVDAGRRASGLVTDAPNCAPVTRHVFNPGAFFRPVDICFRLSNSTPPFLLHWTPHRGAFCFQGDLKNWPSWSSRLRRGGWW